VRDFSLDKTREPFAQRDRRDEQRAILGLAGVTGQVVEQVRDICRDRIIRGK